MPTTHSNVIQLRWRPQLSFGARLRMIRLAYAERLEVDRLSQDEFATMLGVKKGTYGQWEAGNNKPADLVAFAQRVEELTGADPAWLLGVTEAPQNGPGGQEAASTIWKAPTLHNVVPLRPRATERKRAA